MATRLADLGKVIERLRQAAADQRGTGKPEIDPAPGREGTGQQPKSEAPEREADEAQKKIAPPAKPANIGGIIQPY